MDIIKRIEEAKIIPIIVPENAEDVIPVCQALQVGGLMVAEITFRTPSVREALGLMKKNFPDFILGAGTITEMEELESCIQLGAQFAVSPGLNPDIVKRAQELGFPFFPGVCTPTEVDTALRLGCKVLKFFPSDVMGGTKAIKALYGPFKHKGVKFIPTGGINEKNLKEHLATPGVIAIGGSWLVSKTILQEKSWDQITQKTRESLAIISVL
ncbi:bifunctional 4-hydroxy-2-oxoglutarate aldolase/2-dehydro-3-deoxy-phosphogluconate aldolase [Candidatus Sumerlaeota bacterium]|nr:bifunctional 4-hydroxy-2-oxoglutarate aldolase/2-dehydro-3-deoxy-phosphogluconate aldolase [Candidatus Sumerlaeota bacterium]